MVDSDEWVLNPFAKLSVEGRNSPSPQAIWVVALRQEGAWAKTRVTKKERPRLFALLHGLVAANGDLELELFGDDAEALRAVGLLLPPDEIPTPVRFHVPIADEFLEAGADAPGLIVHPSITHKAPIDLELPPVELQPGPILWVTDSRTAVTSPFWIQSSEDPSSYSPGGGAQHLGNGLRRKLRAAGILMSPEDLERQRDQGTQQQASAATHFSSTGWAVVPGLLPPLQISALQRYYRALIAKGVVKFGDWQTDRRYVIHNEPLSRMFLTAFTGVVTRVVGTPVKPAYTFFSSYREGATLPRHRDRAQCEYSISFLVGYDPTPDGPSPWPLWMSNDATSAGAPVHQRVGDGIVYKGCELYHYRSELAPGHASTHIFFHYVPSDFTGQLD